MPNTVIEVEDLAKQYRLGQVGRSTLSHDVNRWWYKLRGKEDPYLKIGQENDRLTKSDDEYVWALKDINFKVNEGEVLGIIGRNGAGKSTLLKILSKVTAPTKGQVKIRGRIASLLEVGTGFHQDLSGRENIFLNGAILGMTKKEIAAKFDEIVDFAGVERYIDTPVKRYSSGMYVRLAFAVAAHLEPEILIIDEVLAVGDAEFQKKCLGKMKDVSEKDGRTVLFVSHNMDAIKNLCERALLLHNGTLLLNDQVDNALKYYINNSIKSSSAFWQVKDTKPHPHFAHISLQMSGQQPNLNLILHCTCKSKDDNIRKAFIAIDIKNSFGVTIMQAIPHLQPFTNFIENTYSCEIEISLQGLIPDKYILSFWLGPHNNETFDFAEDILYFDVIESPTKGRIVPHSTKHGFIVPQSKLIVD